MFPSVPPTLYTNSIPATVSNIYVQQSSEERYKTATNWIAFSEKIQSNNIYLSLVRFNKKNKEYIDKKLTKPTNPSAESAVTMLADGTVGTKPLSEIGGSGGKLYMHKIFIMFKEFTGGGSIVIYSTSSTAITELPSYSYYKMVLTGPTISGVVRVDAISSTTNVDFYGVVSSSGGEATAYFARPFTIKDFSDSVTEL